MWQKLVWHSCFCCSHGNYVFIDVVMQLRIFLDNLAQVWGVWKLHCLKSNITATVVAVVVIGTFCNVRDVIPLSHGKFNAIHNKLH